MSQRSIRAVLVIVALAAGLVARAKEASEAAAFKLEIPAEDRALWANVKAGRFTQQSFAEAALRASGVTDVARRKAYLERIDALEKQAREELAGAKTPFEKGERLLTWLHG